MTDLGNIPVMSCSSALPSWVGKLADGTVMRIEAYGKVVICCQMCHTGNDIAKIPVCPPKLDSYELASKSHLSYPGHGSPQSPVRMRCGSARALPQSTIWTQTRKCVTVVFNRPTCLTWNMAAYCRCWHWKAGLKVDIGVSKMTKQHASWSRRLYCVISPPNVLDCVLHATGHGLTLLKLGKHKDLPGKTYQIPLYYIFNQYVKFILLQNTTQTEKYVYTTTTCAGSA